MKVAVCVSGLAHGRSEMVNLLALGRKVVLLAPN